MYARPSQVGASRHPSCATLKFNRLGLGNFAKSIQTPINHAIDGVILVDQPQHTACFLPPPLSSTAPILSLPYLILPKPHIILPLLCGGSLHLCGSLRMWTRADPPTGFAANLPETGADTYSALLPRPDLKHQYVRRHRAAVVGDNDICPGTWVPCTEDSFKPTCGFEWCCRQMTSTSCQLFGLSTLPYSRRRLPSHRMDSRCFAIYVGASLVIQTGGSIDLVFCSEFTSLLGLLTTYCMLARIYPLSKLSPHYI
ncbi:hypothetical protein DFH07DRAFT_775574 [Mycena maculata]|uniref:Uncharacterized protein n=1 Tax=Mycena maculata TaxID=230809 RepID=A0AAD7N741_9AGAR|nr:hypothetical protein DFH07DRAFT_775574 [Mycena maculata]